MKKLKYQHKIYLLLGGFIFFLYAGYHFSFSDTFILANELDTKITKLNWLKEKEKELPFIKAKLSEFEKSYSKSDSISVRDKLTAFISEFAEKHRCLVTEIPHKSSFNNNNLKIQTNIFTIKGNYHELLKLIHQLENERKYLAKIMSARFYAVKDMQTARKDLYLTLITQSFEQTSS